MTGLATSARQLLRKLRRDRKGSISLLAGLSLTAVVGVAGLGTEAAYWYVKERNMQSAADSGAIAAAAATLANDTSGNAITAATTMAAQYGFNVGAISVTTGCSDSTQATVVCINNPPKAGSHTSDAKAWEVTVTQTQPRLFSALFMSSDPAISTRAVATQVASAPSCVVTLDTTKLFPDLQDNGTANVSMPNCNVFVNSCDPNGALTVSGNGQYLANASFVCGNVVRSGAATLTDTNGTDKNTGSIYPNPYANTTFAGLFGSDNPPCQYNNTVVSKSQSLSPGVYCGGLAINGGNVDLSPGTYIINGTGQASATGLQINGTANVSCSVCNPTNGEGVTIALTGSGSSPSTWASVQINGTATVSLSAPTPNAPGGGVAPFLFYQNQNAPVVGNGTINNKFNGNGTDQFQGVFYFPNQEIQWNGNSNVSGKCVQLVVYQTVFNGTNNFSSDPTNCQNLGITSLQAPGGIGVALVE